MKRSVERFLGVAIVVAVTVMLEQGVSAAAVTVSPDTSIRLAEGDTGHSDDLFSTWNDFSTRKNFTLLQTTYATFEAALEAQLGAVTLQQKYRINSAVLNVGDAGNNYVSIANAYSMITDYDPAVASLTSNAVGSTWIGGDFSSADYNAVVQATSVTNVDGVSADFVFSPELIQGWIDSGSAEALYFAPGDIRFAGSETGIANIRWTLDAEIVNRYPHATIVQWGAPGGESDIVTAQVFTATMTNTYVSGTAINPSIGAGYYPNNTGRNPIFNGAYGNVAGGGRYGGGELWVNNGDYFAAGQNTGKPGNGTTNTVLFMWESDNFLDVTNAIYALDSISFEGAMRSTGGEGTYRYVLQEFMGGYHISQEFTHTPGTAYAIYSSSVTGMTWYAYTPFNIGVDTIGAQSDPNLRNFKGIGFYTAVKNDAENWAEQRTRYFGVEVSFPPPLATTIILK